MTYILLVDYHWSSTIFSPSWVPYGGGKPSYKYDLTIVMIREYNLLTHNKNNASNIYTLKLFFLLLLFVFFCFGLSWEYCICSRTTSKISKMFSFLGFFLVSKIHQLVDWNHILVDWCLIVDYYYVDFWLTTLSYFPPINQLTNIPYQSTSHASIDWFPKKNISFINKLA